MKCDRKARVLAAVLLLALGARLGLLLVTVEAPGDGPTRAIMAYEWSRDPHVVTDGWWPPGLLYLVGLLDMALARPDRTSRLLNATVGSFTILPFSFVVGRVFGSEVALVSALGLAGLPLHIELSATSLTEAIFVFQMLVALACFLVAFDRRPLHVPALCAGTLGALWATTTRYEAWALVLIFPVYAWCRSRRLLLAVVILSSLLAFPLMWSVGNYLKSGDAFLGFTLAGRGTEAEPGAHTVGLRRSVGLLLEHLQTEYGLPLVLLALVGGVGLLARRGLPRRHDQLLYAGLALACWAMLAAAGTARGSSLYPRYRLLGLVLLLPLPMAALGAIPSKPAVLVVTMLCLGSLWHGYDGLAKGRYLRREEPAGIAALAEWLRSSPYSKSDMLATEMEWRVSYLPLRWPEVSRRLHVVSLWLPDDGLEWVLGRHPTLLITVDADRTSQARIEAAVGYPIDADRLIATFEDVKVYRLN